ncbi:MAG: DUF3857 domain-containing protein [Lentimicrobiaceae bacterium]|nr:DUF3857 domain-containing protein [Lentimicrobiaceae bacterium]
MKTPTLMIAGLMAVFLFPAPSAHAQKDPVKYGKIEPGDLEMSFYDKDTSAHAVILADFGTSSFNYTDHSGFQLQFSRIIRIKFFHKEGFDYASAVIPLYHSGENKEKLIDLKGCTYNLVDGEIVKDKLTNDAIFTEEVSKTWDHVKFTMPNVREGSVVEYSYKIVSDFLFNLQSWQFQFEIPVRWSEYRVTVPEYFYYNKTMYGYEPLEINENNTTTEQFNYIVRPDRAVSNANTSQESVQVLASYWRMAARDVPAFKEEAFMLSDENYLTKIEFELASIKFPQQMAKSFTQTWESIDNMLNKEDQFGGQLTKKEFVKDLADAINAQYSSPQEKANAAYDLVKSTIAWNGKKDILASSNIRKAFNEKTGNVADVNLILIALLKGVGLEAYPVILSTRDHGIVHPSHPTVSKFNYLVAQVNINDQTFLMDATEKYSPIGLVPFRCLNFKGRIIKPEGSDWVAITPSHSHKQILLNELTMTPEGLLTGKQSLQADGYAALDLRKEIHAESTPEAYIDKRKEKDPDITIQSFEIENLDSLDSPITRSYMLDIDNQVTVAGDMIYFNPMLTYGMDENPLKLEKRSYPVDLGHPIEESYILKFTVPEGFIIEEQPENAIINLPDNGGKFIYNVTFVGNMLQVMSKYTITQTLFTPDQYENIKEFFNQIVQKQNQQIVLKKT